MTAELFIAHVAGRWQCYSTPDGILRTNVGPAHATPRAAIAYCAAQDAPETPAMDTDGTCEVGGRLGPSDATPAMRGAPQLDLAGLWGPASEDEAATFRGSPDAEPPSDVRG